MKGDKGQPHKRTINPLITLALCTQESFLLLLSTSTFCFLMSITGNKHHLKMCQMPNQICISNWTALMPSFGILSFVLEAMLPPYAILGKGMCLIRVLFILQIWKAPILPAGKQRQTVCNDHHLPFLPTSMDQFLCL